MRQILFVCTANMCRSPMAEAFMQRLLERNGRASEIRAASAGVRAVDGSPAIRNAIAIMAERGIDITGHRSRALTPELVEDAALILTMEKELANIIKARFPQYGYRVCLLTEMVGLDDDVEDPVGGTLEDYGHTAEEIQYIVERGYRTIMRLIGSGEYVRKILFVCTANTCRSPMAEAFMQRLLERDGRAGEIRAASAGVRAVDGSPAIRNAIAIMAERGIDITGHRSRALTPELVEDAALILTMEKELADVIKTRFPQHGYRVCLLTEMVGLDDDIEDPVSGTLEDYGETAKEIQHVIEQGYRTIMRLIG